MVPARSACSSAEMKFGGGAPRVGQVPDLGIRDIRDINHRAVHANAPDDGARPRPCTSRAFVRQRSHQAVGVTGAITPITLSSGAGIGSAVADRLAGFEVTDL